MKTGSIILSFLILCMGIALSQNVLAQANAHVPSGFYQPTPIYVPQYNFEMPAGDLFPYIDEQDASHPLYHYYKYLRNWTSDHNTNWCKQDGVTSLDAWVDETCNDYKQPLKGLISGAGDMSGLISPHQMMNSTFFYTSVCKHKISGFNPQTPGSISLGWDMSPTEGHAYTGCWGGQDLVAVPGIKTNGGQAAVNAAYFADSGSDLHPDMDDNVAPFQHILLDPVNMAFEVDTVRVADAGEVAVSVTDGFFWGAGAIETLVPTTTPLYPSITPWVHFIGNPGYSVNKIELLAVDRIFGSPDVAMLVRDANGAGKVSLARNVSRDYQSDCIKDALVTGGCPASHGCTDPYASPTDWANCQACLGQATGTGQDLREAVAACPVNMEYDESHIITLELPGTNNPVFIATMPYYQGDWVKMIPPGQGSCPAGGGHCWARHDGQRLNESEALSALTAWHQSATRHRDQSALDKIATLFSKLIMPNAYAIDNAFDPATGNGPGPTGQASTHTADCAIICDRVHVGEIGMPNNTVDGTSMGGRAACVTICEDFCGDNPNTNVSNPAPGSLLANYPLIEEHRQDLAICIAVLGGYFQFQDYDSEEIGFFGLGSDGNEDLVDNPNNSYDWRKTLLNYTPTNYSNGFSPCYYSANFSSALYNQQLDYALENSVSGKGRFTMQHLHLSAYCNKEMCENPDDLRYKYFFDNSNFNVAACDAGTPGGPGPGPGPSPSPTPPPAATAEGKMRLVVVNRGPVDCFAPKVGDPSQTVSNQIHFRNPLFNPDGTISSNSINDTDGIEIWRDNSKDPNNVMPGDDAAKRCGYLSFYDVILGAEDPTIEPVMNGNEQFIVPVGYNPTMLKFGDFNADGRVDDMAVVNTGELGDSPINGSISVVYCAPPKGDQWNPAGEHPICTSQGSGISGADHENTREGTYIVKDIPITDATEAKHPWWADELTALGKRLTLDDGELLKAANDPKFLACIDPQPNGDIYPKCSAAVCADFWHCRTTALIPRDASDLAVTFIDSIEQSVGKWALYTNSVSGETGNDDLVENYYFDVKMQLKAEHSAGNFAGSYLDSSKPMKLLALDYSPAPLGITSGFFQNDRYQNFFGVDAMVALLISEFIAPGWWGVINLPVGGQSPDVVNLNAYCPAISVGFQNTRNIATYHPILGSSTSTSIASIGRCTADYTESVLYPHQGTHAPHGIDIQDSAAATYWGARDKNIEHGLGWGPKFLNSQYTNWQTERGFFHGTTDFFASRPQGFHMDVQFDLSQDLALLNGVPLKFPQTEIFGSDNNKSYGLVYESCQADRFEMSSLINTTWGRDTTVANCEGMDILNPDLDLECEFDITNQWNTPVPHDCLQRYSTLNDNAGVACCLMLERPENDQYLSRLSQGEIYPDSACPGLDPIDCCRQQLLAQSDQWTYTVPTADSSARPILDLPDGIYNGGLDCAPQECVGVAQAWVEACTAGQCDGPEKDEMCECYPGNPFCEPLEDECPPFLRDADCCGDNDDWQALSPQALAECFPEDCPPELDAAGCCDTWPDINVATCIEEADPCEAFRGHEKEACCEKHDGNVTAMFADPAPECFPPTEEGGPSPACGDLNININITGTVNAPIELGDMIYCCQCVGAGQHDMTCEMTCKGQTDCDVLALQGQSPPECVKDLCVNNPDLPGCQTSSTNPAVAAVCEDIMRWEDQSNWDQLENAETAQANLAALCGERQETKNNPNSLCIPNHGTVALLVDLSQTSGQMLKGLGVLPADADLASVDLNQVLDNTTAQLSVFQTKGWTPPRVSSENTTLSALGADPGFLVRESTQVASGSPSLGEPLSIAMGWDFSDADRKGGTPNGDLQSFEVELAVGNRNIVCDAPPLLRFGDISGGKTGPTKGCSLSPQNAGNPVDWPMVWIIFGFIALFTTRIAEARRKS